MPDALARALAFMKRADMGGTVVRPLRFGTAVFTPSLPLRYDSNYVLVERLPVHVGGEEVLAEAEAAFERAGLAHRAVVFFDEAAGERVAAALADGTWAVHRHVVMAQVREPESSAVLSPVEEVDEREARPARRAAITAEPWGSPEVAEQLLEARTLLARTVSVRCFVVRSGGAVVSYADLYSDGETAQVEDVATVPEHRGRGYAKAVVLRAAQAARAGGASLVFLVADEADWPQHLYRRLGFDPLGRYVKLYRRGG